MTIFFTSDTHFGHTNIIKYCNRPFSDSREMDEALIQAWNEKVRSKYDTVFHLGDFALCNPKRAEKIFKALNGYKILVVGNHDPTRIQNFEWDELTNTMRFAKIEKYHIIMFHYPMVSWPHSNCRSIHLHGHTHGNIPDTGCRFDMGVDNWGYAPVSWEELKQAKGL